MKSDRIIRLTHRQSNRAALVRGDHMALPARVRHIRAEALQQRIRRAGEKANARRLQPVNKPSSFNHLSPSFHIREAYLFTIHYCLFPAPDYAPRPWGMQPNTSFRLRMCISPLMSRSNIIPFSPCTNTLHWQTFLLPNCQNSPDLIHHPVRHLLQYVSVNPKPQLATSNHAFCHRPPPSMCTRPDAGNKMSSLKTTV